MEHDKTLLFRHCEKCEHKFTKLRETVGRSWVIFLAERRVIFFSLLVNVLSTDSVQKADQSEPPVRDP